MKIMKREKGEEEEEGEYKMRGNNEGERGQGVKSKGWGG